MKKIQYLFLGLVIIAAACSKDEDEKQMAITDQQAAAMIAISLSSQDGGLATMLDQSADIIAEVNGGSSSGRVAECGFSDETNFSWSSDQGATPSYSFNYDYDYTVSCAGGSEPSLLELSMDYDGYLTTEDLDLTYDGDMDMAVSGINADILSYNGQFNQILEMTWTGEQADDMTNTYHYTLTDLTLQKSNVQIISGTAALNVSGHTNEGIYDITAVVTYNGDGTATVVVNGSTFGVNLQTGAIEG